MKHVMIVTLMMLGTGVFAQHRNEGSHKKNHQELKEILSLTDEQDGKVKAINEKYRNQFMTLRKDSTQAPGYVKTERKKLMIERDAELKKTLTNDQYNKLNSLRSHRKGHHKNSRRGNGLNADQLKTDLTLTEDQYSKIKAIDNQFQDQFKKLRSDSTLTKEKSREAYHKVKADKLEAIDKLLSPDQKALLASLQRDHHKRRKNMH